jgi:hypothetical protein
MPEFLSTEQLAERLGIATGTLEQWRCRGEGPPFVRAGSRRVLYNVDSLATWLKTNEHRSTSEYAGSASATAA